MFEPMIYRLLLFFFLLQFLRAQEEKYLDFTFGATLYTYGAGGEIFFQRYNDNGMTDVFYMGLGALKHREEEKFPSVYQDQGGKDFVFGKINYAYSLRLAYGKSVALLPAGHKHAVSLQGGIMGGLALGILTPYYIDVAVPQSGNYVLPKTTVYNPNLHSYYDIIGKTNFFKHIGPLKYYPGFTINSFIVLNFGKNDAFARMIRLGIQTELFGKPLPILTDLKARSFWFAPYIALGIGNRQ